MAETSEVAMAIRSSTTLRRDSEAPSRVTCRVTTRIVKAPDTTRVMMEWR
jgi:hypothetical protein